MRRNPQTVGNPISRSTVMDSLTTDFFMLAALLSMLAYLLLSTFGLNRNRRIRGMRRRITDRLLSWGK
jgi:hypothetical protein